MEFHQQRIIPVKWYHKRTGLEGGKQMLKLCSLTLARQLEVSTYSKRAAMTCVNCDREVDETHRMYEANLSALADIVLRLNEIIEERINVHGDAIVAMKKSRQSSDPDEVRQRLTQLAKLKPLEVTAILQDADVVFNDFEKTSQDHLRQFALREMCAQFQQSHD